ncbi:MAG: ABC transporter substrate-binding protein [Thalassotalea sp.]
MMKKITLKFLAIALVASQTLATTAFAEPAKNNNSQAILIDQTDPYFMVSKVAEKTFKRFAAEHADIQKNPNLLKDIVREELIPYVNYRYAALKVLGKNLRSQKRSEVEAFIPIFREYLVTSYAQVFTLYNQQEVEFEQPKAIDGKKTIAVGVEVIQPGRPAIKIDFQVRKDKHTNQWQAFNMIAEGVSLLDSKRAELSSLINQKGLPYVTELLKEKSQRNIYFDQA